MDTQTKMPGRAQVQNMPLWHMGARILAVVFLIVIIHESLLPVASTPSATHFDKLMHLAAYGALAAAYKFGWPALKPVALALGLIAVGGAVEIAQDVMAAGRTASFADGIANSLGVVLGISFAILILRIVRRGDGVSNRDSFRLAPEK